MKTSLKILTITMAMVFVGGANAAIIDNGTYTTDTVSGLDWLDVTVTKGDAWDTVNAGLATTYAGYSFASRAQVDTLWSNATGVTPNINAITSISDSASLALRTSLGFTTGTSVYGLTSDVSGLGSHYWIRTTSIDYSNENALTNSDSFAAFPTGSFLVKNSVVVTPLPAAVWLFGSGLVGLVGVSKRKKAIKAGAIMA